MRGQANPIVRSNLCTSAQLGQFITSYPKDYDSSTSSIYTIALQFSPDSPPSNSPPIIENPESKESEAEAEAEAEEELIEAIEEGINTEEEAEEAIEILKGELGSDRRKVGIRKTGKYGSAIEAGSSGSTSYIGPVPYDVPKTGYYCVGEYSSSTFCVEDSS